MRKRLLTICLSILMCVCTLSVGVKAQPEEIPSSSGVPVRVFENTKEIDQQYEYTSLLDGYIDQVFKENLDRQKGLPMDRMVLGDSLQGAERNVYLKLVQGIKEVAAGTRTNTEFVYTPAQLGMKNTYTAADLGVDYLYDSETGENSQAREILNKLVGCDFSKLVDMLLADLPFDLYWFDKTNYYSFNYPHFYYSNYDDTYVVYGSYSLKMAVAGEFAKDGETYEVDPSAGALANKAAAKANSIVAKYRSLGDYEKLLAYKNEICEMVEYNDDAVNQNMDYGNPWQLLWVFDDDPSTKVVCEGYSKAFQYLCELSEFNSRVMCYSVVGLMGFGSGGGRHMWNVVKMANNQNYIVDVTNCDGNSVGSPNGLFMVGSDYPVVKMTSANEGSIYNVYYGYGVTLYGMPVTYEYDKEMFEAFDMDDLVIAKQDYDPNADYTICYAVLMDNGDLVFARSRNLYEKGSVHTLKDINGHSYRGRIFTGFEENDDFGFLYRRWTDYADKIKKAYVASGSWVKPYTVTGWFSECSNLTDFNIKGFDFSQTLDMIGLFDNCTSIESVDFTGADLNNCMWLDQSFQGCTALQNVSFSGVSVPNLLNCENMFFGCSLLGSIDISGFGTSSNTVMSDMFSGCATLYQIKVGPGFTAWSEDALLPAGEWKNGSYAMNETSLAQTYVTDPVKYAGWWIRGNVDVVMRIYGDDRYETSLKVARYLLKVQNREQFDSVVITTGKEFADALSGSYLANQLNAPIILIRNSKSVRNAIKDFLTKYVKADGEVVILGGSAAVDQEWLSGISQRITRVAGDTRYLTNIEILNKVHFGQGKLLVCTGKNFADSLSASAVDLPILLVGNKLNKDQKKCLQNLGMSLEFYPVGGDQAVSDQVLEELEAYGTVHERLMGNDRYETSKVIAETFFPNATDAVLAYGKNYPDGLSAGALAYALKAPLLLVSSSKSASSFAADYCSSRGIHYGKVIGGPGLITDNFVYRVFSLSTSTPVVKY